MGRSKLALQAEAPLGGWQAPGQPAPVLTARPAMSEEAQEQPASCSSSGGESTSTQGERLDDYFVRHKVGAFLRPRPCAAAAAARQYCRLIHHRCCPSRLLLQLSKHDTLAGLAVKYNVTVSAPPGLPAGCPDSSRAAVAPFRSGRLSPSQRCCLQTTQVSDIKRANGLLADSAMFAKDTLLIPTRPLPVGCVPPPACLPACSGAGELQQWAGHPGPPLLARLQAAAGASCIHNYQLLQLCTAHATCRRPEYSTWAGMIVTHYGRLGGSAGDEATPSESADMHAAHFSQTRAMRQLRGYYSTGPSRTQSPQYGSGAVLR